MSMGGWKHGGANVTARTVVPEGWIDPWEAQQIRIWGLERWKLLKAAENQARLERGQQIKKFDK